MIKDYWVDVCDGCGLASCWHGEYMCENSRSRGIKSVKASELRKEELEDSSMFSVKRLTEICGFVEYV